MITIKPKLTGRDKQILNIIFNELYDELIPRYQRQVNVLIEILDSNNVSFTSDQLHVIEYCLNNRILPTTEYKFEEVLNIQQELNRAGTEGITNMLDKYGGN